MRQLVGLQAQPYGILFRRVVRPRLAPPSRFEDSAPPRFAQTVGLGFALLIGRAAYIQIIGTDFYLEQGEKRYAQTLDVPASRGRIR